MEESSDNKLVWNFDDAESKLIFDMKQRFIYYRDLWDLESSYWILLSLLSEIEPLFDETIQAELNKDFETITEKRNETEKFSNFNGDEEKSKGECFIQINNFYRKLMKEVVEKDYYFRKKKDYLGL